VAAQRRQLAAALALALVATLLLVPRDAAILAMVQTATAGWEDLARAVSQFGRFENSSLGLAMIAGLIGMLFNSARWREIAVACVIAGILAGITVNVLRPTFGRARPHAAAAPGFYGFELDGDLQSMPSGHAMSNAASAFALVPLVPAMLVPATAYTLLIAWSRMALNRHYPSDVMWGSLLGAIFGLAVGASVRDRRRPARSTGRGRN
jgi:membrane-associated phospholipid phosphatase